MKYFYFSALFILLFWSLFVPAFEFPDEQAHFATVAYLAETGKLPSGDSPDVSAELAQTEAILGTLRDSRGNNRYTYHPEKKLAFSTNLYGPGEGEILERNNSLDRNTYQFKEAARYPALYYRLVGLGYKLTFSQSLFDRLFTGRIISVVFGLLTVLVGFKIGRELFKSDHQAFAVAALTALQPMMSFVSTGINSDGLHNFLFSLIILFCLRLIKYEHIGDVVFYLIIFVGLDFLTKPQAYIALPIIGLSYLIRCLIRKNLMQFIAFLVGGLYLVFGSGLLTHNQAVYHFLQTGELPFVTYFIHPDTPQFFDFARYSLDRLIHQNIVWYWGVFKWLGVVLPRPWWWLANRLVLISLVGLVVGYFKHYSKSQKASISFLLLSSAIYLLAIFWFDWQYIKANAVQVAVQARYYFPMLIAHLSILYAGLLGFSNSSKYQKFVTKALLVFFVGLQLAGIYTIAKSYYDLSSIKTLFLQASQYKPLFAKGIMWWIWGGLYAVGLGNILYHTMKAKSNI